MKKPDPNPLSLAWLRARADELDRAIAHYMRELAEVGREIAKRLLGEVDDA